MELSHAGASMDTILTLRNTTTPFTSTPLTAALFFVLGTWEWTHLGLYTAVLCSISSALLFVLLPLEGLPTKAAVLYVSVGNHYSALYLVLYLMPSLAETPGQPSNITVFAPSGRDQLHMVQWESPENMIEQVRFIYTVIIEDLANPDGDGRFPYQCVCCYYARAVADGLYIRSSECDKRENTG